MSFVNPLFLLGALVAAVPILLHLIKREHARKIEFPTLMFLRRITKRTIRYQKLRHLLLLLLRILALLLIVLAFMRPYRETAQATGPGAAATSTHIIALDVSMSMGYQDRWARAQKAAVDIIKGAGPGDRFGLLSFSDKTEVLLPPTSDASQALAQIESGVGLTDQPTRYGQALKTAERLALDAGAGKRILHLISDFQKNGWANEEQEYRLGAGSELKIVDVGSDDFSNLAVRDVHVIESDQNAAAGMRIKASIVNFGSRDREEVPVKLLIDSRTVADKQIRVAKGSSEGIEFQLPGLLSGLHAVVLEVGDAYLTKDNQFYMTLEARGRTPVLVVDNPDVRGRRPTSFFLDKALNVDQVSPYRLTVASPKNFALSGGLLIWNDTPGGSAATQRKLQDFVRAGGGLAVVLGETARAADFNRTFGSWLPVKMAESGVPEIRTRRRPAENYALMTDVRLDHPIFQPFGKPHSGTFSGARFFSHARISVAGGAEVPARFDNGDPAVASIALDKGRVLVFASSADDTLNDLPLKAVYAPFWQQMLRYLEGFKEQRRWVNVGDIVTPAKILAETALRQAKGSPDPEEAVAILNPKRQRLEWKPDAEDVILEQAGFYEIRTMNLNAVVAVNTVPRESDLTHGHAEEMVAGWLSSKPAVLAGDERPAPEEQDKRQHVWVYLLIAALLFLASESLLSNSRLAIGSKSDRPAQM